jgi:hypothetical protein
VGERRALQREPGQCVGVWIVAADQALEDFFGPGEHAMPDQAESHRQYERATADYR